MGAPLSLSQLLRASDALADLTDDELEAFAALGESRHIAPGTMFQAAGVPWSGLCVLLEGALRASDQAGETRHVPRGTLLEWPAALGDAPISQAQYTAPWGGAHIVVWLRPVVEAFFTQRPHLLGLVQQRIDTLPSPRTGVPPPSGAVAPSPPERPARRSKAAWRRAALRWRLQSGEKKAASLAALLALTLAQWMPMVYVRFVVGSALMHQRSTRAWLLGMACAWALATLMGLVPWRRQDADAAASRALRLWLLNIGLVFCSSWLAMTAWPLALILGLGQLASCACAVRLMGLRNHRHPIYIVLQNLDLNRQTNRWRHIARLTNLVATGTLVMVGARTLQLGEVEMHDFIAAIFLGMMMQHAWRESFAHTLVVDDATGSPGAHARGSIMASPDIKLDPGQRLGVVGTSGMGLSWAAASAACCLAMPRAIVSIHAPLQDGPLLHFLGVDHERDALIQALRWSGADRCVQELSEGLATHVTRFDPRLSLQQRVCLHAARLMLEAPAGLVLDACLDLVDPQLAQVLLTNLTCALPHTRMGIVTHQADILRRCHRVVVSTPNQALQEGDFYGLWTRGLLAPLTYYRHA